MDRTTFSDPAVVDWSKRVRRPRARRRGEGRGAAHRGALPGLLVSRPCVFLDGGRKRDRPPRGRLPRRAISARRRSHPERQDADPRGPGEAQGDVERRRGDRNRERARAAARPPRLRPDRAPHRHRGRRPRAAGGLPALRCSSSSSRRWRRPVRRDGRSHRDRSSRGSGPTRAAASSRRRYVTGLGKRGDVATARAVTADTLRRHGRGHAVRGRPGRGARRRREAPGHNGPRRSPPYGAPRLARREERRRARRRASSGSSTSPRRSRRAGRTDEAKKAYLAALDGRGAFDAPLSTRARAHGARGEGARPRRVKHARRAVELSNGERRPGAGGPRAALRATGDAPAPPPP